MDKQNNIDSIDSVTTLEHPKFIEPIKINYTHKNKKREWEAVISHDSVCILLWHIQKDAFIIVKQLRATVLNSKADDGYMYELCAGIVDKDIPNINIAKEEVLEECGYNIPIKSFSKISSYYTSVGISGAKQTLYFATCNSSMMVNNGGGIDDENIEVIYLPVIKAKEFMFDTEHKKTPGMMMAFYWFFDNIYTK